MHGSTCSVSVLSLARLLSFSGNPINSLQVCRVQFKKAGGKVFKMSYPCAMLNVMVAENNTNDQFAVGVLLRRLLYCSCTTLAALVQCVGVCWQPQAAFQPLMLLLLHSSLLSSTFDPFPGRHHHRQRLCFSLAGS